MSQGKYKICILGYQRLAELSKKAISTLEFMDAEITVSDCNTDEVLAEVRKQQNIGCDIFIASSGNAAVVRRAFQLPLVELEYSELDYLSGLLKALSLGHRPAFVRHKYAAEIPASRFSELIGMEIPVFTYEDSFELQHIIMRDDIDVVIGTTYPVDIAERLGKSGVLLSPNVEIIQNAIRKAYRWVENQRKSLEQQRIINAIIAQPNMGIIVTNRAGEITIFNAAAQAITGFSRTQVLDQPLMQVLPSLSNLPPAPDTNEYCEGRRLLNCAMVRCREKALTLKNDVFAKIYYLNVDNRRREKASRPAHMLQKDWESLVSEAEAMAICVQEAKRLADIPDSICIMGEPHTGRVHLAECIFGASERKNAPLIILDFSLIPPEYTLSYLLGTENSDGVIYGILETANGGGIVIRHFQAASDEGRRIIEQVAAKRPFYRVNGRLPITLDIRLFAVAEPEDQALLSSQYYLTTFVLQVPPLRARRADIPILFGQKLVDSLNLSAAAAKRAVTSEIADILCSYAWPGNQAELDRAVHRYAAMLEQAGHATARAKATFLIQAIGEHELINNYILEHPILSTPPAPCDLPAFRAVLEELKALYHLNNTQVAEHLNISRVTLWRYLSAE